MNTKDFTPWVPFDLYDFFGYLFPGVFFLASLLTFAGHSAPNLFNSHAILWTATAKYPFLMGLLLVACSIVLVYATGHFIASISYILYDRVIMAGIIGYPVTHLLSLKKEDRPFSEAAYKYLLLLINIAFILPIFISNHNTLRICYKWIFCAILLLISFRIAVKLARHSFGDKKVDRLGDFTIRAFPIFSIIWLPAKYTIDIFIVIIKGVLGVDRGFPSDMVQKYKKHFEECFGINPDKASTENYWLSYFRTTAISSSHTGIIRTWLHLYGFARNLSTASYLSALLIVIYIYFNPLPNLFAARFQLIVTIILAWAFGWRYLVLYHTYYTKGILRSFFVTTTLLEETPEK
jgi:hypothetical protein